MLGRTQQNCMTCGKEISPCTRGDCAECYAKRKTRNERDQKKSTTCNVYQCKNCDHEEFFEGLDAEGHDNCEECGGDLVFAHVDNVISDSTPTEKWHNRLREVLEQFQREVHATATANGYHDDKPDIGECLQGIWSEILEAKIANGFMSSKYYDSYDNNIPDFLNIEVELADIILRVLDLAQAHGLRVVPAMIAKAAYNKARQGASK